MVDEDLQIGVSPSPRSRMEWQSWQLEGAKGSALTVVSPALRPNMWYRFWARVLLGVTWEKLDG